ncbi:MAG: helix-turn-helix domain-containing protein [Chlamydiia bacterium]
MMEQQPTGQASSPTSAWDPKLQTPEARKALVEYAKTNGIKPAMRHFGCSRNTIRKWLRRFETEGQEGLTGLPRGRRPKAKAAQPAKPNPTTTRFPWPAMPAKESTFNQQVSAQTHTPAQPQVMRPQQNPILQKGPIPLGASLAQQQVQRPHQSPQS